VPWSHTVEAIPVPPVVAAGQQESTGRSDGPRRTVFPAEARTHHPHPGGLIGQEGWCNIGCFVNPGCPAPALGGARPFVTSDASLVRLRCRATAQPHYLSPLYAIATEAHHKLSRPGTAYALFQRVTVDCFHPTLMGWDSRHVFPGLRAVPVDAGKVIPLTPGRYAGSSATVSVWPLK
jgi:hypothetical protein